MSALDALLKSDFNIEKEVYIARLGTHFKIRALSPDEVESIHEQASYYTGKGVNRKKEKDSVKLGYLTIAQGTVVPDFNDQKLKEKAGNVTAPWEVVKALLLPGEQQKMEEGILRASGFGDDEIEEEAVEEIKN